MKLAASVAVRLALCGAVTWLVYRHLGLTGAVVTAPLYGFALASPIYEFLTASYRAGKAMALADVQGRYYQHRGFSIDVMEDDEGARWLLAGDVRKALPSLPRDAVLQRLFPDGARPWPPQRALRVRADALVQLLKDAREPAGIKFKVWVEREVLLGKG